MRRLFFFLVLQIIVLSSVSQNPLSIDSCLTFQPGAEIGMDAEVFSCTQFGYDNSNFGNIEDICATAWTRLGYPSTIRSLFRFDISFIPASLVKSAKLTLYHNPNSPEGVHSSLSGLNSSVLRRITSSWHEQIVTWNNQPTSTTQSEVSLPYTLTQNQDFINIDVTQLIKDDLNNPLGSFGFLFQLQSEVYYRKLVFCSSDHPVDSLRPKLVICLYNQVNSLSEAAKPTSLFEMKPNPANDFIDISLSDKQDINGSFCLYNSLGQLVNEFQTAEDANFILNISHFQPGLYFLVYMNKNGVIERKKLVID